MDYGDGSGVQPLVLNPDKTFRLSHTYADNGSYTVQVRVLDDWGALAEGSLVVTVTNVAPSPSIVSIGATRVEGTAIAVSGTATDPAGANDTLSYAWSVYKDGGPTAFASGTGANWSFTPTDDGSYEIRLTASDEDGGSATASQTISVANVESEPEHCEHRCNTGGRDIDCSQRHGDGPGRCERHIEPTRGRCTRTAVRRRLPAGRERTGASRRRTTAATRSD